MVASIAVKYGNAFRTDIIENIGNAYQATKEYSDANSLIGKGISNLRNITVGALRTFENPRSQLVKLFGSGAAGAQKFLSDVSKTIDEMGPLAELFGHQVTNSEESALYLVYAKRSLGLSSKDIAYYSLDAGTHLENIFDRLDRVRDAVSTAAKNHGVDTKQVSLGMQKLRVNIKDFGHLSDQSLSNLVARMRKLNVSAEDLTSVFGKFKSFEDASKTSAMLFQSFQMNIDALDLITAKDPGEIVDRLRDSMFATGKSYEELNRHEKQLMQQTTGMNDAMLKSLMTFQNMGLSYEEAKQRIANDDPTKKQTDAVKKLTSSITEIQKVMNFTSPFQAFMKGLGKNLQGSKKAREMATSLSSMYETIYMFGLHLDENVIKQATGPFITIIRKIDEVFKSEKFKGILTTGTEAIASVMSHVAGDMSTNKAYNNILKTLDNVSAMEKSGSSDYIKHKDQIKKKTLSIIKSENNKELIAFLEKKKVLTDDGKFVKGIALNEIVRQLKSASLEMSSEEGKKSIDKVSETVSNQVDSLIGGYFQFSAFTDNIGVKGQIKKTTDSLKSMFTDGSGLFGSMFDLGRKLMGGIIKGTAIAFTVFLSILNGTVNDMYDKASGPLTGLIKDAIGHKEGQAFSILDWLGISPNDKEEMENELISSLKGLISTGGTLFMAGSGIASKLYGIFGDLASFMIEKFAQIILAVYDSSSADVQAIMAIPLSIAKIEALASNQAAAGGLESIKDLASRRTDLFDQDSLFKIQSFVLDSGAMESVSQDIQKEASNAGFPYNDAIKRGTDWIIQEYQNSDSYRYIGSGTNVWHYRSAMTRLAGIHEEYLLRKFLSLKEWEKVKVELAMKLFPEGPPSAEDRSQYQNALSLIGKNLKHYANLDQGGTKYNKIWDKWSSNLNAFRPGFMTPQDEQAMNKTFVSYLDTVTSDTPSGKSEIDSKYVLNNLPNMFMKVNDGTFETLNSMLAGGGFKLFTEDGKVIVPHSLDELATISEGNTASLINLFSSAANAYKQASTAVSIMNYSKGINRNSDEYEASGDVIDKMINLVYETLDVCINRDIKVNKQVTL